MVSLHQEFMRVVNSLIEKKLKENPNIELIMLGGSVARGDETEHSDIDINLFVKRKNMPSFSRRFYKYRGKYIEEIFVPIEGFRIENLSAEAKILFDKNKITRNRKILSDKQKQKIFTNNWEKAKHYFKKAGNAYKNGDYEKAVLYTIGTKSLAFILVHSLPPRFDLSFPSFRLFKSIKEISNRLRDKKIYENLIKLYEIDNLNKEKVLRKYEQIYKTIRKCYKNKYPYERNLGFYDTLKIKYNIEGLRLTFEKFPPEFALRFIIGCVIDWSLNCEELWKIQKNRKYKKKIIKLTKEIFGIDEFNQEFAKKKLILSKDLEKRINKFLIVK